jgi:hypothetical protein
VVWSGESDDDVDTYVSDPLAHLVFFKRLQDGLMNLDRDDTGSSSNMIAILLWIIIGIQGKWWVKLLAMVLS